MKKILPIILTIIILTTVAFAIDNSGANAPEVYQGLYPIKYEGENVIFTTTYDSEWYNYEQGKWANAVTLDKIGQMDPSKATVSNITGYYVWIPRYAYLIRTGYGTSNEGRIDIRFLQGTTNTDALGNTYYTANDLDNTYEKWEAVNTVTYIGDRQMEYLVHPAFYFDEELTGIWVEKTERSAVDSINEAIDESRGMTSTSDVYDIYGKYGFLENTNTHLIKPTEYGAVVYLENSIYAPQTAYKVEDLDAGAEYLAGGLREAISVSYDKYKDIYLKDESGKIIDVKGSAFLETSSGTSAWGGQTTVGEELNTSEGIIVKENKYGSLDDDEIDSASIGFRVAITKGTTGNKLKKSYIGGDSYWWLMENGDVWVMGDNDYGKLGMGVENKIEIPKRLELTNNGDKLPPIKEIVRMGDSTYYLTKDGEVYVCGKNFYRQLGVESTETVYDEASWQDIPVVLTPKKINGLSGIKAIETSGDSTWYITEEGDVYVSGENFYGQLGVESTGTVYDEMRWTDVPIVSPVTIINGIAPVKEIKRNGNSVWYIAEDGTVYVCGYNQLGELGVESTGSVWDEMMWADISIVSLVTQIEGIEKIDKVINEPRNTWYVTEEGEVYACGANEFGQLGVESTGTAYDDGWLIDISIVEIAKKIEGLEGVDKVISDGSSTWYITEEGDVYACGKNQYRQLGVESTENIEHPADYVDELVPIVENIVKIDGLERVDEIKSNGKSTWYITQEGYVYVCGKNDYRELGVESTENIWVEEAWETVPIVSFPTQVTGLVGVNEVVNYRNGTWYITRDGKVYVCGYNGDGMLGTESTGIVVDEYSFIETPVVMEPVQLNEFEDVENIVIKSNVIYYITENDEVYVYRRNDNFQFVLEHKQSELLSEAKF